MRKKFNKTLMLNKQTISNLNNLEMGSVKGGLLWETLTEPSIDIVACGGGGSGTGTGLPTDSCPTGNPICG